MSTKDSTRWVRLDGNQGCGCRFSPGHSTDCPENPLAELENQRAAARARRHAVQMERAAIRASFEDTDQDCFEDLRVAASYLRAVAS